MNEKNTNCLICGKPAPPRALHCGPGCRNKGWHRREICKKIDFWYTIAVIVTVVAGIRRWKNVGGQKVANEVRLIDAMRTTTKISRKVTPLIHTGASSVQIYTPTPVGVQWHAEGVSDDYRGGRM